MPVKVTDEMEFEARRVDAERRKVFGDRRFNGNENSQWVGHLGEICFDYWLENQRREREWVVDDPLGNPDFIICGQSIDVKTVERGVKPRPDYLATLQTYQKPKYDWYFFMSYEKPKRLMWFLGAIRVPEFYEKAVYYKEGETMHANCVALTDTAAVTVRDLISAQAFLEQI